MARCPCTVCILLILICCFDTIAQPKSYFRTRKRSPEFYLGPEIMKVSHTLTLQSDIPELGNQKIGQTGIMAGAIAGHRIIRLKLRKGLLQTDASAAQKLRTTLTGGMITFFPLQVISKRFRLIEPYAVIGVTRAKYDFFGNYVPLVPPAVPVSPPESDCVCTCCPGQALPTDPDAVAREPIGDPLEESERLPEGTRLGDISTRNLNAGFGIETHIQVKRVFIHVFAEANYLVPGRISENNVAFAGTSVSGPVEFRVGLSAGISK